MKRESFPRLLNDLVRYRALGLRGRWARVPWMFVLLVAVPTLVTSIYMFLIAAPIYVSESEFVVRARMQPSGSSFGEVLASVAFGFGGGDSTDAFEIDQYIMSRGAAEDLVAHHQLREILDRPEADFLSRFPRFYERPSFENLFKSYTRFVSIGNDSLTGINILRVQAFRPEDARDIAEALLNGSEKLVNALNRRAMNDVVEQAQFQVSEAQERAIRAEIALTQFRSREKLIDPTKASEAGSNLVNQLDAQVVALEAQRNSLAALAPQSPELPDLDQKIRALEVQRGEERTKVAGESNSLAPKIGEYERLMLDRDYAAKSVASADETLEQARLEARKKEVYLERIAEPDVADKAELPDRFGSVLTVFVSALIAYTTIILVVAGLREHRQS